MSTMSKKVWTIEFIAGNPEIFSSVHATEPMMKSEALSAWVRMNTQNPNWRMWLKKNGEVFDRSEAQIKWEAIHEKA